MIEFLNAWWFVILVLAIATGMSAVWLLFINQKKQFCPGWAIPIVAVSHTLLAVLAALLFGWAESGFHSFGSISLFGTIFLLPLTYFAIAAILKKPLGLIFDVMTPCIAFGFLCMRINCLRAGCCVGIIINEASGVRFPNREIEMVLHAGIAIGSMLLCYKKRLSSFVFPLALAVYGLSRFILEFFRDNQSTLFGPFHLPHIWASLAFAFGVSFIVAIAVKNRKEEVHND